MLCLFEEAQFVFVLSVLFEGTVYICTICVVGKYSVSVLSGFFWNHSVYIFVYVCFKRHLELIRASGRYMCVGKRHSVYLFHASCLPRKKQCTYLSVRFRVNFHSLVSGGCVLFIRNRRKGINLIRPYRPNQQLNC